MTALGYKSRSYNFEQIKIDPIGHLSQLLGLNSEIDFIRQHKVEMLPILSGLIVYRQLNHNDKRKILQLVKQLDNPRLFGKVQGILSLIIANPSWNTWCLSDKELRSFFETNKGVSDFLATWFITVDGKIEVGFIASALFAISNDGIRGYLTSSLGKPIADAGLQKLKLSQGAAKASSRAFLVTVIVASVLKKFTDLDVKQAKEELLRRGLLKVEDL